MFQISRVGMQSGGNHVLGHPRAVWPHGAESWWETQSTCRQGNLPDEIHVNGTIDWVKDGGIKKRLEPNGEIRERTPQN